MEFNYSIAEDNIVTILADGNVCVTQPVSPISGEPFTSSEEAQAWAEAHIAERQSWYEAPVE